MIPRKEYLDDLISLKDKKLIKVVTGIRRCGKSTLFELYKDLLLQQGIRKEQILSLDLEDGDLADIDDDRKLYSFVNNKILKDQMNYIFLDEVQRVKDFQKAVDALYIKDNCDVYITGSNAYILSGELATLLSGRYVEIKMLPLSFKEYVSARDKTSDPEHLYQDYIHNSSFPYALELERPRDIRQYLDGIYNSIIVKDIISRRHISDVEMFKSVARFLFDNIGNPVSCKRIADTMTSAGRKISVHTVENYLDALTESFIFYRASRYDIKGKQYLRSGDKYYAADLGLRYHVLGSKKADAGHILENVVYLELLRRGYEVYVGKVDQSEVDFIAVGEEGEEYYQVAYTLVDADGRTLERELSPLDAIKDHNPKYLLTMDYGPLVSHNGIKQLYVLDWLLR